MGLIVGKLKTKRKRVDAWANAEARGAFIRSLMPRMWDEGQLLVDWSKPLANWSTVEMSILVELIWRLIDEGLIALDQKPKPEPEADLNDDISDVPFQKPGNATC